MTVGRFLSSLFKLFLIVLGFGVLVIVFGILSIVYDQCYVQPHQIDRYLAQERQSIVIGEGIGAVGKALRQLNWTYDHMSDWDGHGEVPNSVVLSADPTGKNAYNTLRINFHFRQRKLIRVDGCPPDPIGI